MLHSSPERNPLLAERFEGKESRRLPGNVAGAEIRGLKQGVRNFDLDGFPCLYR
jgi:hypothetical protein